MIGTLLVLLALYLLSTALVYMFGRLANRADTISDYDLGRLAGSGMLSGFSVFVGIANALMWVFVIIRVGISAAIVATVAYGAILFFSLWLHIDGRVLQEYWQSGSFVSLGDFRANSQIVVAAACFLVSLVSFGVRRWMSDAFMGSFYGVFSGLLLVPFLAVMRWMLSALVIAGLLAGTASFVYGAWQYL